MSVELNIFKIAKLIRATVKFISTIVWRDVFKHRYGLKVSILTGYLGKDSNGQIIDTTSPAIMDLPYCRRLTQGYNDWVRGNTSPNTLFFTAHKRHISKLGNIGSVLPHNLANPIFTTSHELDKVLVDMGLTTRKKQTDYQIKPQ